MNLRNSGVYMWYVNIHNKDHFIGETSDTFGSAWQQIYVNNEPGRMVTFKIMQEHVTMINDEDFRYTSSFSIVHLDQ